MARREPNALLDLAWAFKTEDVIAAELANKLVRRRLSWRGRGDKTKIRNAVKQTRPPHGRFKPRVKAVVAEMDRQERLRRKRARNRPYKFEKLDYRQRVTNLWAGAAHDRHYEALNIRQVNGGRLAVLISLYFRRYVLVVGPSPGIGPREQKLVSVKRSGESVFGALLKSYTSKHAFDAIYNGRRVKLDFVKLQTRIETPNGTWRTIPWDISNRRV